MIELTKVYIQGGTRLRLLQCVKGTTPYKFTRGSLSVFYLSYRHPQKINIRNLWLSSSQHRSMEVYLFEFKIGACWQFLANGSFTLAIFVSETVGDCGTRLSLDCCNSSCLGHLGRCDTDRIISIGQGKYIRCDITGAIVSDIVLNFAYVNSA